MKFVSVYCVCVFVYMCACVCVCIGLCVWASEQVSGAASGQFEHHQAAIVGDVPDSKVVSQDSGRAELCGFNRVGGWVGRRPRVVCRGHVIKIVGGTPPYPLTHSHALCRT